MIGTEGTRSRGVIKNFGWQDFLAAVFSVWALSCAISGIMWNIPRGTFWARNIPDKHIQCQISLGTRFSCRPAFHFLGFTPQGCAVVLKTVHYLRTTSLDVRQRGYNALNVQPLWMLRRRAVALRRPGDGSYGGGALDCFLERFAAGRRWKTGDRSDHPIARDCRRS